MARTLPTYEISVAWSDELTGVFRLDVSELDGDDVLPGGFGNNVFDDISGDVRSVRITRGRQGDMGTIEQGRCTLLLKDSDGTYNPLNPNSDLADVLDTHRPLRVRATHGGITYGLFSGFISRITHDPARNQQSSVIEAVDFFEWLNAAKPTVSAMGSTTVGAAIGELLDALEWTDPAFRDLDTGRTIADFEADGTKSALQLIQELLQIDLGVFYLDGSGVATFIAGSARWAGDAPVDTFDGSEISQTKPSIDKQGIINRQTVTRTGGVAQSATADDGKPFYDGSPITSPYLVSDSEALSLASWIVGLRKDGRSPARQVTVWNKDDTQITRQLSRELGDRVALQETPGGTDMEGTIDGLQHEIAPGRLHRVDYLITKRTVEAFTLDVSELDGSDLLTY